MTNRDIPIQKEGNEETNSSYCSINASVLECSQAYLVRGQEIGFLGVQPFSLAVACLLYTSDAADEDSPV